MTNGIWALADISRQPDGGPAQARLLIYPHLMMEKDHPAAPTSLSFGKTCTHPLPKGSMAITGSKSGAIIISASGVATGGRIIHHLKHNISQRCTYYASCGVVIRPTTLAGLSGRGFGQIRGPRIPAKVHTVGGLSAHADVDDLIRWAGNFKSNPHVHVVHHEAEVKQDFRNTLENQAQSAGVSSHILNWIINMPNPIPLPRTRSVQRALKQQAVGERVQNHPE